jgi:hypothetical protein
MMAGIMHVGIVMRVMMRVMNKPFSIPIRQKQIEITE